MSTKIIDVIKYEGDNETFIYKYPVTDFNIGTQLIVHESQEAVFFRDGKALESFYSGRYTLETQNVPFLKNKLIDLANGNDVFHSEVYFINLTTKLGVKWGTDSKIRMFDPFSGLHLEIGASGTFNICVVDGRKLLIKVVGTTDLFNQSQIFGDTTSAIGYFKGMIITKVKTYLSKAIKENDINILEIDEHLEQISEVLRNQINIILDDYGIEIPEFFVTTIQTPDYDPNFIKLKEQYAAKYLKIQEQKIKKAEAQFAQEVAIVEAETEAKTLLIKAEGNAAAAIATGKAEAEIMKAKGYTYQDETSRIVGEAAAKNEGGGGSGIVSDLVKASVGVGVGVQVAKSVANSVTDIIVSDDGTWECPKCSHKGNRGKFCEECGFKKGD